jgi:hypothetical protein
LLGIPPGAVAGKTVVEFGPGSGHNAIATAAFAPQHYRFVDGNPTGIERLRTLFATHAPDVAYDVVESLIEDYAAPERYDLVICEGVIPFQLEPKRFARHVAGFAKAGGIVSLTTIDAVSFLGDLGRRLIGDKLVSTALPAPERVRQLMPAFAPHVATLGAMSRPLEDYLYDNIVQPLPGKMFSIADAIDALDDEFDFYGSSPSFVTDLRWFKSLYGDARATNTRARDAYLRHRRSRAAALADHGRRPRSSRRRTRRRRRRDAGRRLRLVLRPRHAIRQLPAPTGLSRHAKLVEGQPRTSIVVARDRLPQW